MERPRPGMFINDQGNVVEEFDGGVRTSSFAAGNSNIKREKDPKIDVRIKPRAKDHPSDDFKIVVTYEVHLS